MTTTNQTTGESTASRDNTQVMRFQCVSDMLYAIDCAKNKAKREYGQLQRGERVSFPNPCLIACDAVSGDRVSNEPYFIKSSAPSLREVRDMMQANPGLIIRAVFDMSMGTLDARRNGEQDEPTGFSADCDLTVAASSVKTLKLSGNMVDATDRDLLGNPTLEGHSMTPADEGFAASRIETFEATHPATGRKVRVTIPEDDREADDRIAVLEQNIKLAIAQLDLAYTQAPDGMLPAPVSAAKETLKFALKGGAR
jgi:hypothetical protein